MGMTLDKYNRLKNGMTVEQANAVMRPANCEEMSSTKVGGYSHTVYTCESFWDPLAYAILQFESNILVSKAQFGLE